MLEWFHWPDRLTLLWSLIAPTAAALALTHVARRSKVGAAGLTVLILAGALGEHSFAHRGPPAEWRPAPTEGTLLLRDHPHPGAVFDVPLNGRGHMSQTHLEAQLTHGRPTRAHPFLDHLVATPADPSALAVRDNGALRWLTAVHPRSPVPSGHLTAADLDGLHAQGFGWIVLHGGVLPPGLSAAVNTEIESILGNPTLRVGAWQAWALGPTAAE